MNQFRTKGILLRRTNYGEADKIIQLLTPDHGRVSVMAKGVRRGKSKLAGGLELFAECDVTLLKGKGEIYTLTSARIETFYQLILKDYDRVQLGYTCIKEIARATETTDESEFYELLRQSFLFLNELDIPIQLTETWFRLQLAALLGSALNVTHDINNERLSSEKKYNFNTADLQFQPHENGSFSADHIKVLRLLIAKNPHVVNHVAGVSGLLDECLWLSRVVGGA
jgi:DNA repair protein RecO (recombination protein O)